MLAQQLTTIILQNTNIVSLLTAFNKLKAGNALTVGDSGTIAYASIKNLSLVDQAIIFDGLAWNLILFVSSGG